MTKKMSSCYYCGSKEHNIRTCRIDNDKFCIWDKVFSYDYGYMLPLNCKEMFKYEKKTLMRIACLSNVSRVQELKEDRLEYIMVDIKLKQNKEKLILALIDRYNKNKEVIQKWRKKKEKKEECPICYDKLDGDVCTTSCGHTFCTDCFVQTVRRLPRGASCPMCRASLMPKQYTRQSADGEGRFQNTDNRDQFRRDERSTSHLFENTGQLTSIGSEAWRIDRTPNYELLERDITRNLSPDLDGAVEDRPDNIRQQLTHQEAQDHAW